MSQTRLEYLLQRYFKDEATSEEVEEVMLFVEDNGNEAGIKSTMDNCWKEYQADSPVFPIEKSRSILTGILQKNTLQHSAIINIKKKRNWLYAAAAVILLLGSAIIYKLSLTNKATSNIAGTKPVDKDIEPGGNKAMLTLSDGSTIILDSISNGPVTQQGSTKIMKPVDGELVYNASNEKPAGMLFNSVSTPKGGQYQVLLPDGSRAWLNAASSLRFPAAFAGIERKVEMTGEVYFEVAKNASAPFIVNIQGKGEVSVLGTHFNINAYSDEPSIKTTLLEGSVKMMSLSSGVSKMIAPGEQAQLAQRGQLIINRKIKVEKVIAWKNGLFDFSDSDLATVLRQLSRWYDVNIEFEGPVPARQFEGALQRNLDLSQVLRLLEKNGLRFRLEGRKLVVLK